ncbi:hypothetical protein V1525DRAFT_409409 [Lipomyces kononenkoae]|uniref:Uncharacterized protein n=1 Tax=Lipomyces kononenkoae TaxID=34357 RepID=A0ACC3SVF2_LIPKO
MLMTTMPSVKRLRSAEPAVGSEPKLKVDSLFKGSKVRACSECKRHKIKCDMTVDATSCTRCARKGYKCVVNNQLHQFIADDTDWKSNCISQIEQVQAAVSALLQRNGMPNLSTYTSRHRSCPIEHASPSAEDVNEVPAMAMTRENSPEPTLEESELVGAPMRSLYEVTKLRNLRSNLNTASIGGSPHSTMEQDFISRRCITIAEAEMLFSVYNRTMNQFLWGGIAMLHADLESVRRSSSLLTAAIMAVAALHIPNNADLLNTCYKEFAGLVSQSTLNRYHTLDDIRALTIGAFWLSDLSWKLSGQAVRNATEMGLHQCVRKMLKGDNSQHEGAQVWYLVYVLDHQFSTAYGRPPIIREDVAVRNYRTYLRCPESSQRDIRLMAQVALFAILSKAYELFGSDTDQEISEDSFVQLREFSVEIDRWRLHWQPQHLVSPYIGKYPSKGVVLHYHFAKFQVNSLALRSIAPSAKLSTDRKEAADMAISSAIATLSMVLDEPDIRNSIIGVNLYTHAMVAFSAVFLLKIAWKWKATSLNVDQSQVYDIIDKIVSLMSGSLASDKHITFHIAKGLHRMLNHLRSREGNATHLDDRGVKECVDEEEDMSTLAFGFFDQSWNDFTNAVDVFDFFQPGHWTTL